MKALLNKPLDLEFSDEDLTPNPFYTRLEGRFVSPSGRILSIPGFYNGDGVWKIRFSPDEEGKWTYRVYSRDLPSANGQAGTVQAGSEKAHPGVLELNKDYPGHFIHSDGTPYFMNAYECDWLFALDLGTDDLTKTRALLAQIKSHRFNTIIMNLYAHGSHWTPDYDKNFIYSPPAMYVWGGDNDNPDHSRMNTLFFNHFDKLIDLLLEEGIEIHLFYKVYNKLVNYPEKYTPQDDLYFHYITARYQAYPNVVWDFSKESKNEPDKKYILNRLNFIKSLDTYGHLVTTHDDPAYFSKEEQRRSVDFYTAQQHVEYYYAALNARLRYDMPYFNSEFQYEHGPKGYEDITYGVSTTPEDSVQRAWEVIISGGYTAYYYTYTAWNTVDWRYDPPGAACFGILYDFITSIEWWKFEPCLEAINPSTGEALVRGEEEMVFFPGLRERDRSDLFITADLDIEQYEGFWLDILTGKKIPISQGDINKNDKRLIHLTIPFESHTGVLYIRKGE